MAAILLMLAGCGGGGGGGVAATTPRAAPPAAVGTPTMVAAFTRAPAAIAENGGVSTITLRLDATIPTGESALVFPYTITGTGIVAADITAAALTGGTITVPVGSDRGTATITAVQDTEDEGASETMTVTLGTLPLNAADTPARITRASGVSDSLTIAITDDDTPAATVEVTIPSGTANYAAGPPNTGSIAENAGSVVITVSLDVAATVQVTLPFTINTTGTHGTDYVVSSAECTNTAACNATGEDLVFAIGERTKTITVTATDDSVDDDDETVTVALATGTRNGVVVAAADSTVITITDDDAAAPTPAATVEVTIPSGTTDHVAGPPPTGSIAENGGSVVITVSLDVVATVEVTLPFTIDTTGTHGTDYVVSSAECTNTAACAATGEDLVFAIGEQTKTITVTATDDSVDDDDETVTVALATGTRNGVVVAAADSTVITITDDDSGPPPTATIASLFTTIAEGGGSSLSLTIQNAPVNSIATVAYTFVVTGDTATNGASLAFGSGSVDGTLGDGMFTVPEMRADRNASLRINADQDGDSDVETITFTITGITFANGTSIASGNITGSPLVVMTCDDEAGACVSSSGSALNRQLAREASRAALESAQAQVQALGVRERNPLSLQTRAFNDQTLMWAGPVDESGISGASFGMEWASQDGRSLNGVALSATTANLSFSDSGGLSQWSESMTLIAPYLSRRGDSGSVWASAGIGSGEVDLSAGSLGGAATDSQLAFLQAGAQWSAPFTAPALSLAAEGSVIRKEVDGFRLGALSIPDVSADVARMDVAATTAWPFQMAGGVLAPRMALDLSWDGADTLPGQEHRAVSVETGMQWSRDALSVFAETSRALSRSDTASEELSAGMRLELWDDIGLDLETARESVNNDASVNTHRARIGGRWAF